MKKILHKLHASMTTRILVIIILGIIILFILNFILISIGYSAIRESGQAIYDVSCFGLPIYQIVHEGNEYVGNAVGANMSIVGVIIAFAMMIVTEIVVFIHDKRK